MNYKNDFKMLNKDIIYFDNAATTFKPKCVIDAVCDYYMNYSANANRGDYDISLMVDDRIKETRKKVARFINAKSVNEIIFTSGATQGLNMIIKGFFLNYLKSGDEILTTKAEHASLILPWFEVVKKTHCKIRYADLQDDLSLTLDALKRKITKNTKVISLAHVTNVIGDVRPVKEIIKYAHDNDILVVVDGAQSVPHDKIDVQDMDADFLVFSAHKMLGPTGVGILYGKEELLNQIKPLITGGGMNKYFDGLMNVQYKDIPEKLEAGTPNIAGIIGFEKAIDYLNKIGMKNVHKYETDLKKYAISQLSKLKKITIYNKNTSSGIITFNVNGISSKDVGEYLNKKKVCIRVGSHCAKILSEVLGVKSTCRCSLYFYNTKEDIDKLVNELDNI